MLRQILIPAVISLLCLSILMSGCSNTAARETRKQARLAEEYISAAESYRSGFQYDEALRYYKKALEIDAENADLLYSIGHIYALKHGQEGDRSIIGGRKNQQGRIIRHPESSYSYSIKYLRKAADLGHIEARQLLRAIHDNIQHLDVKY